MESRNRKVGVLTFHASYNCGSMLQAYALQCFLHKEGYLPEIIDFIPVGQKKVYSVFMKNNSLKNIIKNLIIAPHRKCIARNYSRYEVFKSQQFTLTSYSTNTSSRIVDRYDAVIAGSDQIWNITIEDFDDAYFLPWVKTSKRIAYAPSFGARNLMEYACDVEKYKRYLNSFDFISIRENNGQKWIKELLGHNVPIVLDPTLIIEPGDYEKIISNELVLPEKYIFYYSPGFSHEINRLVSKISKKYRLPVIAFNSKSFYLNGMNFTNFKLPEAEDPKLYLQLLKNATMVVTTSFHGSIFSAIFMKNFWVVKNGGMFQSDDRVKTLVEQLALQDRLIPIQFGRDFNYMENPNYEEYESRVQKLKEKSRKFLLCALEGKEIH